VLVRADSVGTGSGNAGAGTVAFTAAGETLSDNFVAAGTSSIAATLRDHTTLTGTLKHVALTLDSGSTWKVTADSVLTRLTDGAAVSGLSIKNIVSNGHNVYYDASLTANSKLGGKTYSLVGGGHLKPR